MNYKYSNSRDNSLSGIIKSVSDQIYNEYKHQKELQQLKEEIERDVLNSISVKVIDDATPVIKALQKELDKLG